MTQEDDVVCATCDGTGRVEVYGGTEMDEWDVVDSSPCPDCGGLGEIDPI